MRLSRSPCFLFSVLATVLSCHPGAEARRRSPLPLPLGAIEAPTFRSRSAVARAYGKAVARSIPRSAFRGRLLVALAPPPKSGPSFRRARVVPVVTRAKRRRRGVVPSDSGVTVAVGPYEAVRLDRGIPRVAALSRRATGPCLMGAPGPAARCMREHRRLLAEGKVKLPSASEVVFLSLSARTFDRAYWSMRPQSLPPSARQ